MLAVAAKDVVGFFEPLGMIWVVLIGYGVWLYRHQRKRETIFIAGVVLFIWVMGATPFSALLLAGLERPYAGLEFDDVPRADAVILLGGGATVSRYEASKMHLTPSGDRVIMAYDLMLAEKAPVMVVGGGSVSYKGDNFVLSEITRDWLVSNKLEPGNVIALPHCKDTHDEALFVAEMAKTNGWDQLLLVTSATHMRRAAATFRTQGVNVFEVPCNFHTLVGRFGGYTVTIIPKPGGFEKMGNYLHEKIGWFYYRMRGRISKEAVQKSPSFNQ
ncbi:MAG: YdcF family protein [Limisphaerales bacterium]